MVILNRPRPHDSVAAQIVSIIKLKYLDDKHLLRSVLDCEWSLKKIVFFNPLTVQWIFKFRLKKCIFLFTFRNIYDRKCKEKNFLFFYFTLSVPSLG